MKTIFSRCLISLIFALIVNTITAQEKIFSKENEKPTNQAYFGFGAGLDYGGFGIKAEYVLAESAGIFAGFGFNLYEPAYNAGLSFKFLPGKKVQPV
ncbi:MAG: hypothetical protein ABIN93_04415, partial [Ginsengibacter sp.]